jgi:hypothetical protein
LASEEECRGSGVWSFSTIAAESDLEKSLVLESNQLLVKNADYHPQTLIRILELLLWNAVF